MPRPMTTTPTPGLFIVLDGNDGSGKATQAQLLADALTARGREHIKIDFPRYESNLFGKLLAECLSGARGDFVTLDPRIASVLYAADRLESSHHIQDALAAGKVVIADRFVSSNQIHQGGKVADETEREAFLTWLDTMEHDTLGIPRPDRIVYLKVPVATSLGLLAEKRRAKNTHLADGELDQVERDTAYLHNSHATAGWLAAREPAWRIIECADETGNMRTREAIHADVLAALTDVL